MAQLVQAFDPPAGFLERLVIAVALPGELLDMCGGRQAGLEPRAQLVALFGQLRGVAVLEAVERELLRCAARQQVREAGDDRVGCREVAVDLGEVAARDVKARLVAVA